MRSLLTLGVSALALAQAHAQQPSPAQMGMTHTALPEVLQVLDAAQTWVPIGTVSNHMFLDTRRAISPVAFGAKCDGATDDTTALQNWAAAATDGAHLVVPGTCLFTGQIAFALAYGVTVEGPGTLIYAGTSTTLDPIVQIGQRNFSNGCAAVSWRIKNITVLSNTVMTAGDGLRISDACQTEIEGLTVGGTLGHTNTNFYNAAHYDGGNSVHTRGYSFSSSGAALAINGDTNLARQFTDPMFLHGLITGASVGLHICGGVGGFEADMTSDLGNGSNVLIDRTCVALANNQMFFGPQFASDTTSGGAGIGVHMSDPGGSGTMIIYKGWLASATNQCFLFDAGTPDNPSIPPQVDFSGARIGNCHAPTASNGTGVENQSVYADMSVAGGRFFTSQGGKPTIYNVSGAPPIAVQAVKVDANFSITGAWSGSYANPTGTITATPFSSLSAPSLITTGPGATVQWRPQGGTQPADTKNWDILVNGSTGDMALRVLNDAYSSANAYVTFYRGTGYGLTGAKTAFAAPVEVPGYTIASLPGCIAGLQGANAYVTNGQATPPYLGTVSATGAVIAPVFCNGSGWVYH